MPTPTTHLSSGRGSSPHEEPPGSPGSDESSSESRSAYSGRLKADAQDFAPTIHSDSGSSTIPDDQVPQSLSPGKSETGSVSGGASVVGSAAAAGGGKPGVSPSDGSSSFHPSVIEDGDEITWLNRMAWEHGVNTSHCDDEGPYKLFVGCLPFDTTEHDLYPLFAQFGDIVELAIQRDREGRSKGCAWLKYLTRESCDDCIARLHGQFYVGHVRAAMQVKYATGELEKRENRVYLIGLPRDETEMAEHELLTALDAYGEIREFMLFRKQGRSTGACFVKFNAREPATTLVQACHLRQFHVNNMHLPAVRAYFANQIRRFSSTESPSSSHNSQVGGGGVPLPKAPSSSREADSSGISSSGYTLGRVPSGTGHPDETRGGGTSQQRVDGSPDPINTSSGLLRAAEPETTATSGNSETRQPPSVLIPSPNLPQEDLTPAKLFVGCLPYSKTTIDLAQLFGQFGPILEVALLTNSEGKSKGAAFVTFAYAPDAEAAMSMNEYCFPGSSRSINVSYATNQTWVPGGMGNSNNRNGGPRGGGASSRTGGTQSYFPLKHGIPGAAGSPPLMFTSNRYATVSSVASTAYDQSPPSGPLASVGGVMLPVEALHQGHHYLAGPQHQRQQQQQAHEIPDPSPTGISATVNHISAMNPSQQQQIMSRLLANMVQGPNPQIANPQIATAVAAAHQQAVAAAAAAAAAVAAAQQSPPGNNQDNISINDLSPQSAFINHIRQPLPAGSPIARIPSSDGDTTVLSSMTGVNPFSNFAPPPQGSPSSSAIYRMMQYQQRFGQQSPSNVMLPIVPPHFPSGSLAPGSDCSPTFGIFQGYLSPLHFSTSATAAAHFTNGTDDATASPPPQDESVSN